LKYVRAERERERECVCEKKQTVEVARLRNETKMANNVNIYVIVLRLP
jgi:hypothetical protein